MKTKLPAVKSIGQKCAWFVLVAFGIVLATRNAMAAVAFTVTPAAVSNTYNGTITLQVTGLNPGETVLFQKYLDANSNSVIDAGDLLFQQFKLTDGSAMVIGGVTNFNVPGDTDTTAGQITAKLTFQPDFSQTIAGKYLFKLSSPTNHFTPVTNSFMVTNYPYAQKFTGTVMSNGVPVPNAGVILFLPLSGDSLNPIGGTVANNSGVYTIPAPAGTYLLAAFQSNCIADTTAAANLVLGNGVIFNTNLNLIPATQSISGKFIDTNTSAGLPGLFLAVQTKNKNLIGLGFTDTNGNFSVHVNANQWGIGGDTADLAFYGYVGPQNKTVIDTTGGSVSGVTIALHKATALFYGSVKDNLGNVLPGGTVEIYANDNNNGLYEIDGYTDANGNYVAGVVGGLGSNDPWYLDVDNSSSFPNYDFSQPDLDQNGGTNIAAGQAVQGNFIAIPAPNHISGTVKDSNNSPLSHIGVNANTTSPINGLYYSAHVDTDTNGNYVINLATGNWQINLNCCDSCGDGLSSSTYQCPNGTNLSVNGNLSSINFVVPLVGKSELSGYVADNNFDPIASVTVLASGDGTNYSTITDTNGFYAFAVADGDWTISVDCSNLIALGFSCGGSLDVPISGADSSDNNLIVQPPPLFITSPLPAGTVGVPYFEQLQADGGAPPYDWEMFDGALPGGLNLSTNGTISGVPTNSGTFDFAAVVSDNFGDEAGEGFSLLINPAPLPDYLFYYITKTKVFSQISANTVLQNPGTPARTILGVYQYGTGSVSNGVVDLPGGATATLLAGNTPQELDAITAFQSQAAMDAAYPNGQYDFVINGQHNGLQLLSVTLNASTNYPVTPQISDFSAAQLVNASNAFTVQWLLDASGPNDFIWFFGHDH